MDRGINELDEQMQGHVREKETRDDLKILLFSMTRPTIMLTLS